MEKKLRTIPFNELITGNFENMILAQESVVVVGQRLENYALNMFVETGRALET